MFAPVRLDGATVKICPPLIITADAIRDGLLALDEAMTETAGQLGRA
jgi:4-aminobutyrate aminotransferase-like enzyme